MAEQFTIPTRGDIIAGKYLIQEELGRGSYGVVFRARQMGVERDVALKTLLPQAFLQTDIVERFQREASMVSRLQHPNIVTLYDFGENEGVLYMAMEFVRGHSLAQVIKEEAPVPPERAVHLIQQVLRALQAAHREGIIHRDLKPENIILSRFEDDPDFAKVLDFGIAKLTGGEGTDALKTLTVQGYVLGTPYYMSPETITGSAVNHQADLYAVGLLLYELLTGNHPFEAPNPSAVLVRHLSDPIPPLEDPEQEKGFLGYAIRGALAKEPENRIQSAAEFLNILEGQTTPHHFAPAPSPEAPSSPPPWHKIALLGGLAGIVFLTALLGVLLWFFASQKPAPEPRPPITAPVTKTPETTPESPTTNALSQDKPAQATPAMPKPTGEAPPTPTAPETDAQTPKPPSHKKSLAKTQPTPTKTTPRASTKAPKTTPKPSPRPKATPVKAAPPARTLTTLRFESEPPGARVTLNGAPACTTPCNKTVEGNEPYKVIFSKVGYKQRVQSITPAGASQKVTARLKPGRIKLLP